jgi:glycosyltransferase involved in cell wall biosynthesis
MGSPPLGRRDLLLLGTGTRLAPGGRERLDRAADSDRSIATVSAMLRGGPWAPRVPPGLTFEEAAALIGRGSACLRPRITAPVEGCVLVRRWALDLLGLEAFEEGDCPPLEVVGEALTRRGLIHVLADDVLAEGPLGNAAAPPPEELAVTRALAAAGRGLGPVSVTVDGRGLGPRWAGTQVHALELIAALARTGDVRVRVVVPPDLDPRAADVLARTDGVSTLPYAAAAAGGAPATDVVHRPDQVFSPSDLLLLAPLGRRMVVTHQDLIAYRNPGYAEELEAWHRHRRVTRSALSAVDAVVFFSEHARRDALADDLVDPTTATVVPIGTDHRVTAAGATSRRPAGVPADDRPFLLCLGTDLEHKNRPFAFRLLAALRDEHGWNGSLICAGPPAAAGSSRVQEDSLLERDPDLAGRVARLGQVDEGERGWLLASAAAVVYPTLYEGFGLLPFEAGRAGVPCLFAGVTALEALPGELATLVPWDVSASAAAVRSLLTPGEARSRHVAGLAAAAEARTWDAHAHGMIELYREVIAAPERTTRQAARDRLELEARLDANEEARRQEWQEFQRFRAEVGSDGLALVGPGGILDRREQRALLALGSQPALGGALLGAVRLLHRVAATITGRAGGG